MLLHIVSIPSEFISRLAAAVEGDPKGRRRATLIGAQLGLTWAVVGRVWMRLISQEHVFSVPGTLLILLVVSGFGAAAGFAFGARRHPVRTWRGRWGYRLLGWVPLLGMGPFAVLFLGQLAYAWRASHPRARRAVRFALGGLAVAVTGFWLLVLVSQHPEGPGWAAALLYLVLGYLLYAALRFALHPAPTASAGPPSPA